MPAMSAGRSLVGAGHARDAFSRAQREGHRAMYPVGARRALLQAGAGHARDVRRDQSSPRESNRFSEGPASSSCSVWVVVTGPAAGRPRGGGSSAAAAS